MGNQTKHENRRSPAYGEIIRQLLRERAEYKSKIMRGEVAVDPKEYWNVCMKLNSIYGATGFPKNEESA